MELVQMLGPEAVRASFKVLCKKRLLHDLTRMAVSVYGLPADEVYQALQERERLASTGVGYGIAIPHVHLASADRIAGLFVRLETPVQFGSLDRQPVDLVFTLLGPVEADVGHLKALARVSRKLRNNAVCSKLRSTFDASALHSILTEGEPCTLPGRGSQTLPTRKFFRRALATA